MPLASIETRYEHIVIDENGIAIVSGTNIKVVELVLVKLAHGWSPEELYFQHPHLTLGQIYSALAYYWDHQEELDFIINYDIKYRMGRDGGDEDVPDQEAGL